MLPLFGQRRWGSEGVSNLKVPMVLTQSLNLLHQMCLRLVFPLNRSAIPAWSSYPASRCYLRWKRNPMAAYVDMH
ncbi:hypothetical protein K443DRAFT_678755 [Laccaria amethystina LaAM-08-1]|uniref:Uncharacterized protein n=1 Tax=Laccaria amethystina LaAM-08-1 TaxID=1095629 RepID=A0A0C9XHQ6_9AGAR|nr:hypothetical protein K443DRAFT_678755 [Laccaria amethystina LaAM-08-1]